MVPARLLLAVWVAAHGVPAQREPPAWRADRKVVLTAGDPGVSLGGPTRIAVSPRGVIAATQPLDGLIQLFAEDGKPIAMVSAWVPGTFDVRRASRFGFRAESVWIADSATNRITVLGPGHELARVFVAVPPQVDEPRGGANSSAMAVEALLNGGGVLLASRVSRGPEGAASETRLQVMRRKPASLVSLPPLRTTPKAFRVGRTSQRLRPLNALERDDRFDVSSNGTFIAIVHEPREGSRDSIVVRLFNADGSERYGRAIPIRKEAILPAVQRILVGDDGTVWLRLTHRRESERWLILEPRGGARATLTLPARPDREVQDVARGRLWATELTPEGLPQVVSYRLLPPG